MARESTADRLEHITSVVPGTMGYCVTTLDGETLYHRNADQDFTQASAIKIPILMTLFAEREAGTVDWQQQHRITKQDQVDGTGVLYHFSDGHSLVSTCDLATLMIVLSDNSATNLLIELVGMPRVNELMDSLGFTRTRLKRMMRDDDAIHRGVENLSTPTEAARIMGLLARREFISPAISNEVLAVLRMPKSTAIRKGVPADIPIANKPGAVPGIATEWAIVEHPQRPYVVVVMGKDGEDAKFQTAFTEITRCVHHSLAEP